MLPIRSMFVVMALLLLIGSTVAVFAFAQQREEPGPPDQKVQTGAPAPNPPAVRALLDARIETAREILKQDLERLRVGGGVWTDLFDEIPVWSRRLMEDRLRLATTPGQRVEAIREHRSRMVLLEQLMVRYAETGQGRISDALKGKYYRLEADQFLAEAGVDPAKEPPAAEPRKGSAPPPAPPLPPPAAPR